MRSHLTYLVLRRIIQNQPLSHKHCVNLQRRCSARPASWTAVRSFWGFSRKQKREPKEKSMDPGFGDMMELSSLLKQKARPPPSADVVHAFRIFFASKQLGSIPLSDVQIQHSMTTFKHLKAVEAREAGARLGFADLQAALGSLTHRPRDEQNGQRLDLATFLFEDMRLRKGEFQPRKDHESFEKLVLLPYLRILCQCGQGAKARDLLDAQWQEVPSQVEDVELWTPPLKAFIREHNEEELTRTIRLMGERHMPFNAHIQYTILNAYLLQDDFESVKKWFHYPLADGKPPPSDNKTIVLKMCMSRKEFDYGKPIFSSMLEQHPKKRAWDFIFQWAAATGKGVDEIERMMGVMVRRNTEAGDGSRPDVGTINGLVELANSMDDPYTAERYIALAERMKIQPNAQTFILQMDYRLKRGDLSGARRAYGELQAYEVRGDIDIPLINKLILSLCDDDEQNYGAIMEYAEDLTDRNARFEPATVAALCLVHLRRNELHDTIDLLQTHAYHYGSEERARIRDTLLEFCFDRTNSVSQAWDTYSILREVFGETENATRLRLMNEFFTRGRSDMGTHVFGHMRQSPHKDGRPTADAYTQCLEGIALNSDAKSLGIVHNMLKLDSEVEPNTRLYNALMLAYSACGQPLRSLDFWDDIAYSREGPTYNSIRIALRACEDAPFGDERAHEIWNRLRRFEVEMTPEIYAAYVGALAGQGLLSEAKELVERMQGTVGSPPDILTIGTLYNASPGQGKRAKAAEWARRRYPAVWRDLETIGLERAEGKGVEFDMFKIDRQVPA